MTFEPVRTSIFIGLAALVVMLLSLGYFTWANGTSRNLALATGTLFGACILFAVQLIFELRGTTETAAIATEYTIDRAGPWIRQWAYRYSTGWRVNAEVEAGRAHPAAFAGDRDKLAKEFAVFSVVAYLHWDRADWQMKRDRFQTGTSRMELFQGVSKADECTRFTGVQLREMLKAAGNSFAETPQAFSDTKWLCLPPNSSMQITPDSVIIRNPVCQIVLSVDNIISWDYTSPDRSVREQPLLADGKPKYETRVIPIRVSIKWHWARAQDRNLAKYRQWTTDLLDGARVWFAIPDPSEAGVTR